MRHGPPFALILPLLIAYTAVKYRQIFLWRWVSSFLAALATFSLMLGWLFLARYQRASHEPHLWANLLLVLTWSGSIVLGAWAVFILFSLAYDILFWAGFLVQRIFVTELDQKRRQFFIRGIPAGIMGASGVMSAIGIGEAFTGPSIKTVDLPLPLLSPELRGLKIVQISDLHMSPLINTKYVSRVVDMALSLQPDIIAVTGDIADGTPATLKAPLEILKNLKAPLGTYYVTGNHEYYWGVEAWLQAVKDMGFIPLINESRVLNFNGHPFLLGGVTDTSGGQYLDEHESDPIKAMGENRNIPTKILLAHRPESCFEAQKVQWNIQLSGHTHAGQFFPFSLLMPLSHKYYQGLNQHKDMMVYVNAGTGFWGPPQRFAIPSEITLLKLGTPS